jgi:hypothetical protein
MVKSPGFALVGIISMGLGMGLTTMVYNSKWQLIIYSSGKISSSGMLRQRRSAVECRAGTHRYVARVD